MENAELQKVLDGLDLRLALGEIDMGTYSQLKAKFGAQLGGKSDVISTAISSMPKEAVALKCPGCMAALPILSDPSQVNISCEYCGGTFALQTATEEMDRLRNDIHKWISQVAGNAGIGTTVDEASRRFIFNDKLFPPLRSATDHATEVFSMTRYQPLFAFSLLSRIPSSPFFEALQLTPDLSYLVDKAKETVARVQSPEIKIFAVGEKEKCELHALEVQCLETVYLSNIRHHIASFSSDGFKKAKTNLKALTELYTAADQLSSSIDPSYSRFSSALVARMKAIDQAVDILNYLISNPDGVMTDNIIRKLESASIQCEQAINGIETSGREPKDTVPAAEGTRADAQTIRILAACVNLYGQCGAEVGESFTAFLSALEQAIDQTKGPSSDLIWLSNFLTHSVQHMNAVAGEASLPVVSDFGWAEGKMITLVRSSVFSGKESVEGEKKILLPFWVAELDFSQQKGVIFKKGQSMQGLIFLEATRNNGQCYVVPSSDPLCSQSYDAIKSPMPIGQTTPAIAPIVSPENALRRMKQFISTTQGYIGGYAKLLSMVYLPIMIAKYYTKKAERRELLTPSSSIQVSSFNIKPLRIGTKELLFIQ